MALADSDFSRLRAKIKIIENLKKGLMVLLLLLLLFGFGGKCEDRLMTIELWDEGMMGSYLGPSWIGWLVGWNGWNSLGNRVWGNGAYLGNGLGNGGVLVHGQSVRYIHRAQRLQLRCVCSFLFLSFYKCPLLFNLTTEAR